jgi:hypothetical protein
MDEMKNLLIQLNENLFNLNKNKIENKIQQIETVLTNLNNKINSINFIESPKPDSPPLPTKSTITTDSTIPTSLIASFLASRGTSPAACLALSAVLILGDCDSEWIPFILKSLNKFVNFRILNFLISNLNLNISYRNSQNNSKFSEIRREILKKKLGLRSNENDQIIIRIDNESDDWIDGVNEPVNVYNEIEHNRELKGIYDRVFAGLRGDHPPAIMKIFSDQLIQFNFISKLKKRLNKFSPNIDLILISNDVEIALDKLRNPATLNELNKSEQGLGIILFLLRNTRSENHHQVLHNAYPTGKQPLPVLWALAESGMKTGPSGESAIIALDRVRDISCTRPYFNMLLDLVQNDQSVNPRMKTILKRLDRIVL